MPVRIALVTLIVALLLCVAPSFAAASPGPQTCLGAPADSPTTVYPESRQFVDSQSWWQQPGDAEARHLHLGACIPERESLSGTIHIDAKIQLHANPGQVTYVAIVWESSGGDHTYLSVNPGWKCPTTQCVFWKGFDIPVSAWDKSGLNGIRLRATAKQPDGKEMRASLNFQSTINNGKTLSNMTRMPYLRGKGWYTGLNYCEAALRTDLAPLPDGLAPNPWSPWVRQIDHGTTDADPTHHDIRLDPDIHNGVPGTFLANGPGSRDGTISVSTTGGLHKLFAKTDCETAAGVNSGVLVVPFSQ